MSNLSVEENLKNITKQITQAAETASRNPSEISLIAVSKTKPFDLLMEAYRAGQTLFGENRVEEAVEKRGLLPEDAQIDLIGHLQSNKVKDVIGRFRLIHSVDSVKIGEKIARLSGEAGLVQRVLIQVNLLGEETKSGFVNREDLFSALDRLVGLPSIKIEGFMTIAPFTDDQPTIRRCFSQCRELAKEAVGQYSGMIGKELSMGMSGDFPLAIEEGSTMVRVGSSIFGSR